MLYRYALYHLGYKDIPPFAPGCPINDEYRANIINSQKVPPVVQDTFVGGGSVNTDPAIVGKTMLELVDEYIAEHHKFPCADIKEGYKPVSMGNMHLFHRLVANAVDHESFFTLGKESYLYADVAPNPTYCTLHECTPFLELTKFPMGYANVPDCVSMPENHYAFTKRCFVPILARPPRRGNAQDVASSDFADTIAPVTKGMV